MLYQNCRPSHWREVVGNVDTIKYLVAAAENFQRPHAYLFAGPSGSGKTTLARILARELGCAGSDLVEIDVGDYRGIDSVREIRQIMHLRPMMSACRVWILDEVQKMTSDAQAALLKALEDTPPHAYFILATTDPQKLLPTIVNRCTPCPVKTLDEKQMEKVLLRAARSVKFKLEKEAIESLIEIADGTPRTALVALEKHIADPKAPLENLLESSKEVRDLCQCLLKKSPWKSAAKVLTLLKGKNTEEDIRRAVLGYAAAVRMKGSDDSQALVILDIFKDPFYNSGWPGLIWACSLCLQRD